MGGKKGAGGKGASFGMVNPGIIQIHFSKLLYVSISFCLQGFMMFRIYASPFWLFGSPGFMSCACNWPIQKHIPPTFLSFLFM